MNEAKIPTGELAKKVRRASQRISQVSAGDPPGIGLLWRLAAVLDGNQEFADLSDDAIRALLERLIVQLSPRRLHYLVSLKSEEAQALVDSHELRRAGVERLRDHEKP